MKSIAVIGLGQFGHQVAISLTQKGFDVIALDSDIELVTEIKDLVHQAIALDTTDEKAMWAMNIDSVDKAIVAIGSNVQSSLLSTALLKRMEIRDIYVRAITPLQESILKSMGIRNIINIEQEMGVQVSNLISSDRIGRYIEISNRHSLLEITVPSMFRGKSIKDANLRENHKINIVGVKTPVPIIDDDGQVEYRFDMTDIPDPDYCFKKEDLLVISGTDEHLDAFLKLGE
jgi:trk system potassium uptake protein